MKLIVGMFIQFPTPGDMAITYVRNGTAGLCYGVDNIYIRK